MIAGARSIISSKTPEADRAFLSGAIKPPHVEVGDGWLVFGLPPAEVAVHPARKNDVHEFYLMFDDVSALTAAMRKRGVTCGRVQNHGWSLLTYVTLPGGGKLGIYQPRHVRPKAIRARKKSA